MQCERQRDPRLLGKRPHNLGFGFGKEKSQYQNSHVLPRFRHGNARQFGAFQDLPGKSREEALDGGAHHRYYLKDHKGTARKDLSFSLDALAHNNFLPLSRKIQKTVG